MLWRGVEVVVAGLVVEVGFGVWCWLVLGCDVLVVFPCGRLC